MRPHRSIAPDEPLLYRHVRAAGEYDAAGQIYLDNQVMQGRAGYFVVTPLSASRRRASCS